MNPFPPNPQQPQPISGGFNSEASVEGEGEQLTQEKELLELLQMLESHTPVVRMTFGTRC